MNVEIKAADNKTFNNKSIELRFIYLFCWLLSQ